MSAESGVFTGKEQLRELIGLGPVPYHSSKGYLRNRPCALYHLWTSSLFSYAVAQVVALEESSIQIKERVSKGILWVVNDVRLGRIGRVDLNIVPFVIEHDIDPLSFSFSVHLLLLLSKESVRLWRRYWLHIGLLTSAEASKDVQMIST